MQAEISLLKQRLIDPKLDKDRMREYIIRLIYVEMLGHNANFGHIHAVKMTHEANLLNKKVGYLATTLFLHENHELNILIVNTLQQDLKSDNALIGTCSLMVTARSQLASATGGLTLPPFSYLDSLHSSHGSDEAHKRGQHLGDADACRGPAVPPYGHRAEEGCRFSAQVLPAVAGSRFAPPTAIQADAL